MRFLMGLITGIFAGLMLAPSSGSETRRRITQSANDFAESSREKMQNASEAAQQRARQFSEIANEKMQKTSDYVREKAGDVGDAAEALSDAVSEKIHRKLA